MTAYIIVGLTAKDSDKFQRYGASVGPTLEKYSGKLLAKGPVERLHGDFAYQAQVILTFPSKEDAKSWYQSEDYQALIPLRNEGIDSQFQLIG
ncbi:MAG: hypothetical protein ACI808_002858 [Paraglaciecola sp.]|jgi:uncharacterized protein (DUF1330 family)